MTRLKNAAFTVVALLIALAAFALFASFGLAVVGAFAFVALVGGLAAAIATLTAPQRTTIDV